MKKFLSILIITLFFLMPVKADEEKVQVYVLSKDGCSGCEVAIDYFNALLKNHSDLFELNVLEIFDHDFRPVSDDALTLFDKVYSTLIVDYEESATPTMVIGNYTKIGFPSDRTEVYDAIINAKENKEKDQIKALAKELNIDLETLKINKKSNDIYVLIGIFGVLILGVGLMIYANKK